MRRIQSTMLAAGAAVAALAIASGAHAALTLTAAGVADGFTLSTFYTDSATYGMLGMTSTSNGKILGAGYGRNQLALFNDVDGQTQGTALLTASAIGTPTSVATVNGVSYTNALGGGYFSVNTATLVETALTLDTSISAGYGLWGNQINGHLIASTLNNTIVDIDPATGHVRVIESGVFTDGVSVSPDGTTVYGAQPPFINGFNIATGTPALSLFSTRGPDGSGVISGTSFNGFIISNNNDGTVSLINPTTAAETIIASGGSRGDLVGPDGNNGSLLLSDYNNIYRLGLAGGSIGSSAPEPAAWALMLAGFLGLGSALRRRRAVLAA
jgi:hypothetical protein